MSNIIETIGGNLSNTTSVASATGVDGSTVFLFSGGTLVNDTLEAIATSATTSALIEIEDIVSGGSLVATGNAQIELAGVTVSGATLKTGDGAAIGVFGGSDSGVTPISALVEGATVVAGSYIFDDGTLTFSGGSAQANVEFNAEDGDLTLDGMSFGAGDGLSASLGGVLTVSNGTNVFSAKTVVEAGDYGSAVLSGGLANAGTISAYASAAPDTFAGVTIFAGGADVNNSATGRIEAERVGGYGGTAYVDIGGSAAVLNAGIVEAYATDSFDGTAVVVVSGGGVVNTNTIEALATLDTTAVAVVDGTSAVTNSAAMLATGSDDSDAWLGIYTSGGAISNTKTIEASASDSAEAGAVIDDMGSSGSLVNAKNALIEVTATDESTAYEGLPGPEDAGLAISMGGAITNSGIIELAVSDESGASSNIISGASLTNAGTIEATATGDSDIDGLKIEIQSGGTYGSIVNSGTVAFAASNDSDVDGRLVGSSIVNSGSLTATVTGSGQVALDVEALGSGASMINGVGKTIEASATGTGSLAEIYMGGENYTSDTAFTLTNTSATLEAAAAGGGSAIFNLGGLSDGTLVVGGTLKTTGAGAFIGVYDVTNASAISVSIAPDSDVIAWGATLSLSDIVGSIAPGTLLQAADAGHLDVSGNVTNGGTIEALGNETGEVFISAGSAGTISNTGIMEAVASGNTDDRAQLIVSAGSDGSFTNKGTVLASMTDVEAHGASFVVEGGTVTNAGTMTIVGTSGSRANADKFGRISGSSIVNSGTVNVFSNDDSLVYGYLYGSGSASTVSNTGTLLASASIDGSEAYYSVDGGVVTNAKGAKITALANDDGAAGFDIYGLGSSSDTGIVTNSGTMLTTVTDDSEGYFVLEGGAVTNAAGATIETFATSGSYATEIELYGVGSGGSDTGTVINSGALLGSASDDTTYQNYISIFGGTITNAASGTIKAFASNDSEEYVSIHGSGGSNSVITNSGTMLTSASASSDAFIYISDDGGTIVNARTVTAVATTQSEAGVRFVSASSVVNSGTIAALGASDSDGYVEFDFTTVNNTSGVVSAAGNAGIDLDDATISGGTLQTSGSEAAVVVDHSGAIVSATIAKGTQVFADDATLTLGNGDVISSGALVQAADTGTVYVASGATITDFGTLLAGDLGPGAIVVSGVVASGVVHIGQDGVVDVVSGGSASVVFDLNENDGVLEIADSAGAATSAAFTGTVYGFGGFGGELAGQLIDLVDVPYAAGFSATYSLTSADATDANLDTGTLTVTSGGSTFAVIDVVGDYVGAAFNIVSASINGGTVAISDPLMPTTLATAGNGSPAGTIAGGTVALLGSYMASLFASTEGQVGAQTTAETAQSEAVITHPHAT